MKLTKLLKYDYLFFFNVYNDNFVGIIQINYEKK